MKSFLKAMAKTIALTASAAAVMLAISAPTYAANGDNGMYFYDFEDYDEAFGIGKGPDKFMGVANITDNSNLVFQYKNFGPGNIGDEHGGVLKLNAPSFPSFIFPEVVNSGKLKIAFDMKIDDPEGKLSPAIFVYGGTETQITRSRECHLMSFNSTIGGTPNGNVYYAKYLAAWNASTSLPDFKYADAQEWNHYEFVISELNVTGSALLDGYVNGKLLFSGTQLNSATNKNLRTFGIWAERGAGSGASIYIDNFYVKRYTGATEFTAETYGESRFSVENGTIKIAMTERAKEPVTKDNISIVNSQNGTEVTDFEVENFTGRTFDIKINEPVEYGRYNISFNGVIGDLSEKELSGTVIADTEYKTAVIEKKVSYDFNDFTETDGTLPESFLCLENRTNVYASSVSGKSGEEGDYALGFVGMPRDGIHNRVMSEFDTPIDCKDGLDISFDVFTSGADTYFYLADEGDFSASKNGYEDNAILLIKSNGKVYCANNRTDQPSVQVGTVTLESGKWHNINIKVEPDREEDRSYFVISIDGGEEYRVATDRAFHKASVYGIGVGYLRRDKTSAEVRIDNIDVAGGITAYYPQVESMIAYDGLGNAVDLKNNPTAMISEMKISFNTFITHDIEGFITVTEDGAAMPVSMEIIDDNDTYTSTIIIYFNELLNPLREYKIQVDEGIASVYSEDVASFLKYTTEIVANNELGFKCSDFGFDDETKTAKVTFSKNNSDEGSYIYAVAGYKTVTVTNDEGEEVETLALVGMEYVPITISTDDVGKFEYKVKYNGPKADEYKTFLWKYPKLEKLEYSADGTIN